MKVVIHRDRCIGSGSCQFWAPHTFDLDADCKAIAVEPPADPDGALRNAVEGCPIGAIRLEEVC